MKKLFLLLCFIGLAANAQLTPTTNVNYLKFLKVPPVGTKADSLLLYSSDGFGKRISRSAFTYSLQEIYDAHGGEITDGTNTLTLNPEFISVSNASGASSLNGGTGNFYDPVTGNLTSLYPIGISILNAVAGGTSDIRASNVTANRTNQTPDADGTYVVSASNGITTVNADVNGNLDISTLVTGGATNLTNTPSPTNITVNSSTGTGTNLPLATVTNAGLLAPADFTKLGNQSNTNSGDNATNTTSNTYADGKVQNSLSASTTIAPSATAVNTGLATKATDTNVVHLSGTETITGAKTFGVPIILTGQAAPTYTQGKLVYNTDSENLTFYNNNSAVGMDLGREMWNRCYNNTGSTIANGVPVYVTGYDATTGLLTIAPANASIAANTVAIGLTTQSIANSTLGEVTQMGDVHGLNTAAFTAGLPVYLGTTAGTLTQTAPSAPNYRYRIGFVGKSDATTGFITVTPSTAALGNGTANQVFGMNTAGTAQEVKSIVGTSNQILITNTSGQIQAGFTATPVLPNGTTATTQATGNNTTNVSTTAFVQQELSGYTKTLYKSTVNSSAVTGTTSETVLLTIPLSANDFAIGNVMDFIAYINKTGTAGACTIKLKINSTNTMPTGTTGQIGMYTLALSNQAVNFNRSIQIRTGNLAEFFPSSQTAASDMGVVSTSLRSTTTYDPTTVAYLFLTVTPANAGDSLTAAGYSVQRR